MILYLIRHAHAEERYNWSGPDIDRPLISKGIKRANRAFSNFFSKYPHPDKIISSKAARSLGTAEVLHNICGAQIVTRKCINPWAEVSDYYKVIEEFSDAGAIAIIGHEPDMSEFMSDYLTDCKTDMLFKKGSICHIENGFLINFVQQKVLL
jgi:phosphohistidine phosphatase